MGGLLSRYALARLYDGPGTGTFMGGVQGGSYISLASPHLGCGVEVGIARRCPSEPLVSSRLVLFTFNSPSLLVNLSGCLCLG